MSETKMYSVLDKWTDLEKENIVDFTSVDGVVTEARLNGVPVGGGGGGDFSTAEVTFIKDSGDVGDWYGPFIDTVEDVGECLTFESERMHDATLIKKLVLYKGIAYTSIGDYVDEVVSVSENMEQIGRGTYKVTGDCVIHYIGTVEG